MLSFTAPVICREYRVELTYVHHTRTGFGLENRYGKDMGIRMGSRKITAANFKKTWYYLKKNGLGAAFCAARERLSDQSTTKYCYKEPEKEILEAQRQKVFENPITFSILVPMYQTPPEYLRALMESVVAQTYSHWELILADAGCREPEKVKELIDSFQDTRIRHIPLAENEGISGNSNQALKHATGDYIGLLDHDDLLTKDALFENACRIEEAAKKGIQLQLIYSDEDKCDGRGERFYEVYRKKDFNLDMLLSNNYICHFLVLKAEMMQKLKFRCNFDGSQDYDLVLRGVAESLSREEQIAHISRVLYHWRCHEASTAVNPQSKQYAYEAGRRAVEDFLQCRGWKGQVVPLKHLGFFRVEYKPDIFTARQDVGIIGGRLLGKGNKITGGIYEPDGSCPYKGLMDGYSGYMHQAALHQNAAAVDLRCMKIRQELHGLFEEIIGVKYQESETDGYFDYRKLPENTNYTELSLRLCEAAFSRGYRIVWLPELKTKIK